MKITLVFILVITLLSSYASDREKEIKKYVQAELEHYPEARLTDLYKNYFQDAYGPAHIIPDTTKAGVYLNWELNQNDWTDTLRFQALGTNHDYYRINLFLVKDGIIPRDTLLLALVKSAKLARTPDIESFKKEWTEVLSVIKKMNLNLPDMQIHEKLIEEQLSKGDVVMHHSEHYVEKYHPHYRIIHRSFFLKWRSRYL